MDVRTWLEKLGLSQYETVFRDSEIDGDVLTELSEQHLREMGIPLGHRLKMLRAIRERRIEQAHLRNAADRRQLTIMVCDIVDSTALTAQLGTENMCDLIRTFREAVTTAVARFDGHVARWMGDGATIYFGYPCAQEDAAERAARAGLALIEALGRLRHEHGIKLKVRVGISTGLVIVGELIGEGDARERGVVGETPSLAARLQALALPDTVVVSNATRRLLGRRFDLKALGPQDIKGFKEQVVAWSVLRERPNVSRFDASCGEPMTPFIGREQELALLMDRWQRARKGDAHVVMLSGEAGIGKSRLLRTLRKRLGDIELLALRYQCSPHHRNDALYPITGQIWHGAGFVSGEPAGARLTKLESMIERARLEPGGVVPYLAALLAIPTGKRYRPVDMAPADLAEKTMAALTSVLLSLAKTTPLLLLFEDAHWIDATTLDLFNRFVGDMRGHPILIVATARPEFTAPWLHRENCTAISLGRFERDQVVAMIDRIVDTKAFPAEVCEQIVAKTDGVPLFVEELTKSVLESGLLLEENGGYVMASALTPLAIPATLHDSLTARLDRLAPVKNIAQIGAVIGREFSYDLLEAVSPISGEALKDALRRLIDAELIYERDTAHETSYRFKHALVQDAAYVSLLRHQRQRIHGDIANALRQRSAQEDSAALIAHHYTEAGLAHLAAPYLTPAEMAPSPATPAKARRI